MNREPKWRAVATGVWEPKIISKVKEIESVKSDEDLFWMIIEKASHLAVEQNMCISIIAKPGWDYETAVNSLPRWSAEEVAKAGRILWKRTWQD